MGQTELLNVHENNHEKTHDCQKRSPFSPGERHKRDAATRASFCRDNGPNHVHDCPRCSPSKKTKKTKKNKMPPLGQVFAEILRSFLSKDGVRCLLVAPQDDPSMSKWHRLGRGRNRCRTATKMRMPPVLAPCSVALDM